MHQTPGPTHLQLDLREETRIVPGLTALPWATRGGRLVFTTPGGQPECTCPVDCVRDHENE
jgi:hypothetical protein